MESVGIKKFYAGRLGDYGESYQTLWGEQAQSKASERFSIVRKPFFDDGTHFVDLGSGFGQLYQHLEETFDVFDYTAIDIMEEFLELTRQRYPKVKTINIDFINSPDDLPAGDVFCIFGSLNKKWLFGSNFKDDMFFSLLSKLFKKATVGLVLNGISSWVDYERDENVHIDPEQIIKFFKSLDGLASIALQAGIPDREVTILARKK